MTSTQRDPHRVRCAGLTPLDAHLEPWMAALAHDPDRCAELIRTHGSALNLHDFTALARNAAELSDAAEEFGVEMRVFVARKANKTLGLVEAATAAGLGLDVASAGELEQCLALGVEASDLIVSAAVKSRALLAIALEADVPVSVDNADELAAVLDLADALGRQARVALRLAVVASGISATRFGLTAQDWRSLLAGPRPGALLRIEGVHFHLNGYSALERAEGLRQACLLVDHLRAAGHEVAYIDMGGGVPMSYLESQSQWRSFWQGVQDKPEALTWRGDTLGLSDPASARPSTEVYPYWQREVRGPWLRRVLGASGFKRGQTVAEMLTARGLRLHCEPGRAMLDGCGVTLARVAFRKSTSDGVPLIGLEMNRTQVRSTSRDFLVDPLLLRPSDAGEPSPATEAFLVGAYCIEEELLLRRRLEFPDGVAVGDLVLFPNTAGYLMHIVESASHQLPLALNLVASGTDEAVTWRVDGIDAGR